jgi:hypothetical protein
MELILVRELAAARALATWDNGLMRKITEAELARIGAAWEDVCARVADGGTLKAALAHHQITRHSAGLYRASNPEARAQLEQAQRECVEALFDELQETIHRTDIDPSIQRTRVNSLQWQIEKRDPDRFGPRTNIDHKVRGALVLTDILAAADARLAALAHRRAPLIIDATRIDGATPSAPLALADLL